MGDETHGISARSGKFDRGQLGRLGVVGGRLQVIGTARDQTDRQQRRQRDGGGREGPLAAVMGGMGLGH